MPVFMCSARDFICASAKGFILGGGFPVSSFLSDSAFFYIYFIAHSFSFPLSACSGGL